MAAVLLLVVLAISLLPFLASEGRLIPVDCWITAVNEAALCSAACPICEPWRCVSSMTV